MKSLYETIFDTTATPEDFLKPEFIKNNNNIEDLKIESRTLIIKKSKYSLCVNIEPEFIEKMKQYGLDTIKTDKIDLVFPKFGEICSGINIETNALVCFEMDFKAWSITDLSVKTRQMLINPAHRSERGLLTTFKNCRFESSLFMISSTWGKESVRFEPSCTLKADEFEYWLPDDTIHKLCADNMMANNQYNGELKTIVRFFDYLPGPLSLFKKINRLKLQGYTQERNHLDTWSISKKPTDNQLYNKKITLDVPGPWKYGGHKATYC